jgi:dTDP-4-amino-4,6-dideoxygalactose transaminase
MIPRYLPTVQFSTWARWIFSDQSTIAHARARLLADLDCPAGWSASAFPRARHALQAYFLHGLVSCEGRHVVVSAQICPLVPLLARQCGLGVRFVDTESVLPVPSALQYGEAIDERTAAVIVAPMYGLVPSGFSELFDRLRRQPGTQLILDLAQGLGLRDEIHELRQAADAIVYSFGVGKGLDCGGGLLLTRMPQPRLSQRSRTSVLPLVQSLGVRACSALGVYRWLVGSLDSAVENDKEPAAIQEMRGSSSLFCLWQARLSKFLADVARAKARSRRLADVPNLCALCRDTEKNLGGPGTHLRQILRVREPAQRDRLLVHLRRHGIDASPAGEPLPGEYFPGMETTLFANAAAFRRDALRLPFLGRLSERQFEFLVKQLECCDAIRLSA